MVYTWKYELKIIYHAVVNWMATLEAIRIDEWYTGFMGNVQCIIESKDMLQAF